MDSPADERSDRGGITFYLRLGIRAAADDNKRVRTRQTANRCDVPPSEAEGEVLGAFEPFWDFLQNARRAIFRRYHLLRDVCIYAAVTIRSCDARALKASCSRGDPTAAAWTTVPCELCERRWRRGGGDSRVVHGDNVKTKIALGGGIVRRYAVTSGNALRRVLYGRGPRRKRARRVGLAIKDEKTVIPHPFLLADRRRQSSIGAGDKLFLLDLIIFPHCRREQSETVSEKHKTVVKVRRVAAGTARDSMSFGQSPKPFGHRWVATRYITTRAHDA